MTTPAQQAKHYAEQHGFKIEAIGRRYKVTHVATGTTFERGGYPAVLNEMRMLIIGMEDIATGNDQTVFAEVSNGAVTHAATSEAFDTKPVSEIFADIKETFRNLQQVCRPTMREVATMRQRWPWNVYANGEHLASMGNRTAAVQYVRRLMSDGAFRKQRITIDYVPF